MCFAIKSLDVSIFINYINFMSLPTHVEKIKEIIAMDTEELI